MGTLTIGRRVFTVEKNPSGPCGYILRGARGACYLAMPNVRDNVYFLVNARKMTMPFPGLWLTDKNGTLEVI